MFASWDDIDALVSPLSEEQWRTASPLPGWTVHCLVSHIIGTESMLLGKETPAADLSGVDHVRNDIGAMNEGWVQHLNGESGAGLLQMFRTVTGRRRAALSALPDDEWTAVGFTPAGPDSYGRFMRIRVFDCWMHDHDIRQALDRPPSDADLDNPAARTALDEVAASMAFVVGKLGQGARRIAGRNRTDGPVGPDDPGGGRRPGRGGRRLRGSRPDHGDPPRRCAVHPVVRWATDVRRAAGRHRVRR